jgi:hypothetical protein
MSVTILRGIPGSGKSTWVTNQFGKLARPVWPFAPAVDGTGARFSTDDYFCDLEDRYEIDFKKLGEGHATCLKKFTQLIQSVDDSIPLVVDNTSTSIAEIAPYAALAGAFGHSLRLVTLICDPAVAFRRNTHGVPFRTIFLQDQRLREQTALLPPYWPHEITLSQ